MAQNEGFQKTTLAEGDIRRGFEVKRIEFLAEIATTAYEFDHPASGARVLHLHCADPENLFAIAFRTPPSDSTGVPHILEHAVLAGSDRYPLKDVFNELMKGSLKTFINAFTYPDKTIYPVASQTRADFYNLARVYADLVFRPRLLKETFQQEGHHLEFADLKTVESELLISGIVYNEMKGAYSSPDNLMFKALQEGIFSSGPYSFDSGGSPREIPDLTYEKLKSFHERYYSPANARIFLYGNIPPEEHLPFLEEILTGVQRISIDSTIPKQERRDEPKLIFQSYPLGKEESEERKTIVNMAWLLAENTDYETSLLLAVACGALVGSAASPLRKALIDSGLGEDLSPATGLERDFRELVFAVGLRGTDREKAEAIEELIMKTLHSVAEDGFDRELIEGVIHQVEFGGREIIRENYPYGIVLMGRIFHCWLYDGDPLAGLNLPEIIAGIRRKWENDPGLFQRLLKTWFIDNRHRVTSVLTPSKTMQEEELIQLKDQMARIKASLNQEELETIREGALRLKSFQLEPDPPEAARSLPRLLRNEIPPRAERIATESSDIHSVPVLSHDLPTNGIAYLDLAFDVSSLADEFHPFLPLLGKVTLNMGAGGLSYEEMAKRIALATGGASYQLGAGRSLSASPGPGGGGVWQRQIFRIKALNRNIGKAARIMVDLLTAGDLSDEGRMRELILEKRNSLHSSVIPSGHLFAKRSAAASLSLPAWREEQWRGRRQLRFINRLAEDFDGEKNRLPGVLAKLKGEILSRPRLTVNLTGDREALGLLREAAREIIESLPAGSPALIPQPTLPDRASLICPLPSQVSYVARVFPAPAFDDPLAPYLMIISHFLSSGYLYKHIRVQGGAYGGMSQYDQSGGTFALLSYRDPRILETLEVYEKAAAQITGQSLDEDELEKAVIASIGTLDRPLDPAGRAFAAMIRRFAGLTDELRDAFRRRILESDAGAIQKAGADYFAAAGRDSVIAVYGAAEELARIGTQLTDDLVSEPLL